MSKAWVGVTLAAIVVGGIAGYAVMRSRAPDLSPAGPNRDLAPDSLAVYAEFPDLSGMWAKMQTTDAWSDLAASKIAEKALEAQAVKDFLAALDEVSTKAAYPMDAKNSMKFIGRECSVGIALDAKGGEPQVLVLTKLDVEALSKDFLGGKVNLEALWGELQRRTGKVDFVVTASDYKDHKVATAARGDAKYHAALLGDTLAVSTDIALVHAAIDCRVSDGAHSVGKKPGFLADVKALPAGTAGFEWFDLDALDAGRASLDAGLTSLGTSPEGLAAAHAVLDATRGAHSVAFSTVVPDGDLYRATWTFSKSADLFADKGAPPLRDLLSGDWVFYGEIHDFGTIVESWNKSALRKKLGASEVGKWFDGLMDDPSQQVEKLMSFVPGGARSRRARAIGVGRRGVPPVPPDPSATESASDAKDGRELVDRFAMHMGRHALSEQVKLLLNGETAGGVDWTGKAGEAPRFAWTIRLDVEGRLLALAAEGAILEEKKGEVVSEQIGTRNLFSVKAAETTVYWTLVGDAFLVTNDHDLAQTAARFGESKPAGPSARVRDSIAAMKPGWRAFMYLDSERLVEAFTASSAAQPSMQPFHQVMDLYRQLGVIGRDSSSAVYIPEDFGSIEVRGRMTLSEPKSDAARAAMAAVEDREPRCWASLPDTTIAHVTAANFGLPTIWVAMKSVLGENLQQMENDFREQMGMDLEKDLIPAFGREFSFAITFRSIPPAKPPGPGGPGGPPFTLPGFFLGFEVKDTAVVHKALERAFELIEAKGADRPGGAPAKLFEREAREGVEIVRLELPPEQQQQMPVRPALALDDGYLLISSDVDALRAAVDTKKGKHKSVADTAVFARATAVLGRKNTAFALMDWSRCVDQVKEYAPQMGGLAAGGDVKFPDYPEDGNQEEWQRRVQEYQKKMEEARVSGAEKVKTWIDSFRVIDFIGTSSRMSGTVAESTMLVKFSE